MSLLEVRSVTQKFNYHTLLHQVCWTIQQGEACLLLGKNGAGKSTLLRIIAGLLQPTQGEILYQDKLIKTCLKEYRSNLGVLSTQGGFYRNLTAIENLSFYTALRGKKATRTAILEVLEQIGMHKFADFPLHMFSSGMQKKIHIAKFLLSKPMILLLDEPYITLDVETIRFFNQYLYDFLQKGGSLLLVSHQSVPIKGITPTVLTLKQGNLFFEKEV